MVWLFHRDNEVTRIETRFDNESQLYVLRVARPGKETIERFPENAAFEARVQALERELAESRWVQHGAPQLTEDGWRV
jgi:hypothetical protein